MSKISKTINGHDYEIMALPPIPCAKLFYKFMATVGDSFESAFGALDKEGGMSSLGKGIAQLFKSLYTNDPNCDLILELMSQTTRDGKAINRSTIDQFYTGNIGEMREALKESIIYQFSDFFPKELFGVLSNLETKAQESSEL